ncbi:MAG: hypothetical protein KQI78_07255 [Deltaproteobacteria bacterium]|nr:hypothetical protein [Deltaproteobacteria bacterium]
MCDDFMGDFDGSYDDEGLDWEDWMIIGPLSEQIAKEYLERDRIRGDSDASDDDYWGIIDKPW